MDLQEQTKNEFIENKFNQFIRKTKGIKITKALIIKLSAIVFSIIILLFVISNALCMFSPTYIAKKSTSAYMSGNYKTVDRLNLVKNKNIIKDVAKYNKITTTKYLDKFDCESINELISSEAEDFVDSLEDNYGEYTVKIKKTKIEKFTKSELKDIKKMLKTNYDSYIDTDKISKAVDVNVKYRIIGEDDKETSETSLIMVKYKHVWKVANISKIPTYMSYTDTDFDYDDDDYDDDD